MNTHRRILVAEKEQIEGAYVRGMIERRGWHADVVQSGLQVIEKINDAFYDAVIISSELTEVDGIETAQKVRVSHHNLPIIGMANYSLTAERKRFEGVGVDQCLTKPVYKASLLDTLSRIFEKTQGQSTSAA